MTTATPLARYGAVEGALASGFATAQLHHLWGRDLTPCAGSLFHAETHGGKRKAGQKSFSLHISDKSS